LVDLLVIADDLTGALDTGAQFAGQGLRTLVGWGGALEEEADVWVLDTESRDLPPAEARRLVSEQVERALPHVRRLYKKVDSTLRGNPGAELAAVLEASGGGRALLAPAFPAQGRTTLRGRQLVHGVPLDQTPYAAPGTGHSSIAALLHAQAGLATSSVYLEVVRQGVESLASCLQASGDPVLVVDAVEDADLATVAQAATAAGLDRLLAGSAGLAAHLARSGGLSLPGGLLRQPLPLQGATHGPILFVAGTRHPCLPRQLARLEALAAVTVVRQVLGGLLARGEAVVSERGQALAAALAAGDAVVTTEGEPEVAGGGQLIAALLARIASHALAQVRPGALVLTGGDVAMATCRALEARAIRVEGQLEPGIPVGRLAGGPANGLCLVTKAGGFGDDDVLWRVMVALRQLAT
jgi:uncharacterized protein YgbK (DUF1537 family)